MKTLAFLGLPTFFIWGILVFTFNIDLEPVIVDSEPIIDPVQISVIKNTNDVVAVSCATIKQRVDLSSQSITLMEMELEAISELSNALSNSNSNYHDTNSNQKKL